MKIKLSNNSVVEGSCMPMGDHLLEFAFPDSPIPDASLASSVELLNRHNIKFAEYDNYTTVYKSTETGYILSDDGSVYTPPAKPEEPQPPTLEERKAEKKAEVGSACEQAIYLGVSVALPASTEHFSLTEHDQINLFGKQAQLAAGAQQLEYHQDGQPCRYYTAEEMQAILEAAMFHVSYHTTYCNSLNMWIDAAADAETLEGIFYGADIPEEHQSIVLQDYLSALAGEAGPEPGPEPEEGEGNQEEDEEIEEGN